jgi:hypothetical protein
LIENATLNVVNLQAWLAASSGVRYPSGPTHRRSVRLNLTRPAHKQIAS